MSTGPSVWHAWALLNHTVTQPASGGPGRSQAVLFLALPSPCTPGPSHPKRRQKDTQSPLPCPGLM